MKNDRPKDVENRSKNNSNSEVSSPAKCPENVQPVDDKLSPKGESALSHFRQGFKVVPMFSGTKRPAVQWQGPWRDEQSTATIRDHWLRHPDHDITVIAGKDILILDADTEQSIARLCEIEKSHGVQPNRIVQTLRGQHRYFRLEPGVSAKSFGGDSSRNPEVIDIRTGDALALIPPSTDKVYLIDEAEHINDLVAVDQAFVDAINRNNVRISPPPPTQKPSPARPDGYEPEEARLREILDALDPDMGYTDWINVGMGLHHEYQGDNSGLDMFDEWSSQGQKYKGRTETERAWRGFKVNHENPVTIGTLVHLAGLSKSKSDIETLFGPVESNYSNATAADKETTQPGDNLRQYSLRGQRMVMAEEQRERYAVLQGIALDGQWTVIYAPPNMGKTLITLFLIENGIGNKTVDPENLFYINADDNFGGIVEKLEIAEGLGFHMLAPGHRGLKERELEALLRAMVEDNCAQGAIIIIDTLKKFVDLMDKKACANFGNVARLFVANGGTLITLAHVNKNRDGKGQVVYAGVSDIRDDADCAYTLDQIGEENDIRTVEFRNSKNRGGVRPKIPYRYSVKEGLSYDELLQSVEEVPADTADSISPEYRKEHALVQAITAAIKDGHTTKTHLINAVRISADSSRKAVEIVLDQYEGEHTEQHHWKSCRGDRGAKVYSLLLNPE